MTRAKPAERTWVTEVDAAGHRRKPDQVVGEEPLEIRVTWPDHEPETLAVTMRTPGHDFELAAGFLLSEGVVTGSSDVRALRYCDLPVDDAQRYNIVTVHLGAPTDLGSRRRTSTVTSSCGICGTASLDALADRCGPVAAAPYLDAVTLLGLPERLREGQRLFDRTGGVHAAGLFSADGERLLVREDVGRHNAVDKLIGWAALDRRLPLCGVVLVVSGRVSFEVVQKAAVAGIGAVVAVSAPTSLAVHTARRIGMTLAGFVRNGRANVYAGTERILAGDLAETPV
jgi:FdhD protein